MAAGGKNKRKGGELCHLEELGLAGEAVGAEALVEVSAEAGVEALEEVGLVGVIPMPGDGLAMVCLMVIPTGDTDLITHTIAMAQGIPTDS